MSDTVSMLSSLREERMKASPARERLKYLFDQGEFTEIDGYAAAGVIAAYGYVEGDPVYAFSQDMTVRNGAMSAAQAAKIKKTLDLAAKTGVPVVGIYDSFGADVNDPIDALSAYGELLMWINNLSGVVPQIAVVAGTCAGTAAMLAQSADLVIMTEDSEMFVTPNSGIENKAENCAKTGTAALVCKDDKSAVEAAAEILKKLPQNNLAPLPVYEFALPAAAYDKQPEAAVKSVCDELSVVEIYADNGKAAYTALGSVNGETVGFAATNKTGDKLSADDCSKIARFVRLCDAFAVPVVTLVDTEGFLTSDPEETRGAVKNMAILAHAYAEATTVKLAVITGKAYGPAYIALAGKGANADMVFALPEAVISPLAPEAAAELLKHDKLKGAEDTAAAREQLAKEYVEQQASAFVAAKKGVVDDVVTAAELRKTIADALDILSGKRISKLPKKHGNMPI